jgi:hypothetical protein
MNHEPPKSGIPKRKKTEACHRLSCKIDYLLTSNHRDQSTTSEYFTDDYVDLSALPGIHVLAAQKTWMARMGGR